MPDFRGKRGRYVIVFVTSFVLLAGASLVFVLPHIKVWAIRAETKRVLRENRFFAVLTPHHPELAEQFEAMMVDVVRNGGSRDEALGKAIAWGRGAAGPYLVEYAPRASDESIVEYTRTVVESLKGVSSVDSKACYLLLYGVGSEGVEGVTILTPGQEKRIMDSLADVVESAINNPQPPPEQSDGETLGQELIERLRERHGDDFVAALATLAQPLDPEVDREAVCMVTTRMFEEILRLPDPKRGALLRYLYRKERT